MYKHIQSSPLHWLLHILAGILFLFVWQAQSEPAPAVILGVIAFALIFFAFSIRTLTVSDHGEFLDVRYGPLNLLGTKIHYRDMASVEQGQTSIIDGWGIHFIPFRGWTFNLWGFDCAKISLRDREKVIRVGTDDAENLVRFLRKQIEQHTTDSIGGTPRASEQIA